MKTISNAFLLILLLWGLNAHAERWLTADPIEMMERDPRPTISGMSGGTPASPISSSAWGLNTPKIGYPDDYRQRANLYTFVNNNPLSYVDPLGLQAVGYPGSGLPIPNPGGADYGPGPSLPSNWSAPNPTGHGIIILDSSLGLFGLIGGGGGTQTIILDNGQIVSYGYAMAGTGLGANMSCLKGLKAVTPLGKGGSFGMGEVYGVYTPNDYTQWFSSVSGGLVAGGSVSSWPGGSASYTAGAAGIGVNGTLQYYWIISASDPIKSH